MKSEEDDEFDRIERENKMKGQPYHFASQSTWVGLTDEDLKLLSAEWRIVYGAWMDDFARDIEAKLKEKNT
jgi:guanylate kinase